MNDMSSGECGGKKVLLAAPRGYCAGVERAVEAVERALAKHGAPVYVRKQIVHNLHVVRDLEAQGAVFVDDDRRGSRGRGRRAVGPRLPADGVRRGPAARARADRRHLPARHQGARRGAALRGRGPHDRADRPCRSRGGRGHERAGSGPNRPRAGCRRAHAALRCPTAPSRTSRRPRCRSTRRARSSGCCRSGYPHLQGPPREDICYATQNRQDAVKELAGRIDVLLVIGSQNSSNSNRLAEVARERRDTRRTSSTTRARSTPGGSTGRRSSG